MSNSYDLGTLAPKQFQSEEETSFYDSVLTSQANQHFMRPW